MICGSSVILAQENNTRGSEPAVMPPFIRLIARTSYDLVT